ncbi:MAG: lipid-A-disaccharide synthase-related protein [Leptolyngbyaceae cyanobacterium bins.302]|nr:lipid-A-disaccharide synthase-related protein [Leptolyngbyaceae cyanobacterium bins.302]
MPLQSPRYSAIDRLLCLSNGHGEDVIAVRILQALQLLPTCPKLFALPLVGEGTAYHNLGIPLIGPVKSMPSGGFVWMDGRQFARDVRGGLVQLTLTQFEAVRQWTREGGSVLAVGDIFPLLLAYLSGAPYAFVGTAKSEYYLRDGSGKLFPRAWLEGWSGSVYHPWERWMMRRSRCRAIFPRDSLTTKVLQKWEIPAFDLGNPMMDGLEPKMTRSLLPDSVSVGGTRTTIEPYPSWRSRSSTESLAAATSTHDEHDDLRIVLLPGSRIPEAYENWKLMLQAIDGLLKVFPGKPITLLAAISPNLSLEPLSYGLVEYGWQTHQGSQNRSWQLQSFLDSQAPWFMQQQATLILTQHAYANCLHFADWAIAMAGTATEQFVGLGKPAITLAGKGPQFTPKFAEAQTRLLGQSVTLVNRPEQVAIAIQTLMQSPELLQRIAENGHRRMGEPGAADRIAKCLMQELGG